MDAGLETIQGLLTNASGRPPLLRIPNSQQLVIMLWYKLSIFYSRYSLDVSTIKTSITRPPHGFQLDRILRWPAGDKIKLLPISEGLIFL